MILGKIASPTFQLALKNLINQPVNALTAFKLMTILEKVEPEIKRYNQVRDFLIKKYAKLAEDGSFLKSNDGKNYIIEDKEKFEHEFIELGDIEVKLPLIILDEISSCKLSTLELLALKDLLSTP